MFQTAISPGPIYMTRNKGEDSEHRELPKISFPKQKRWKKSKKEKKDISPSPSAYVLPTPKTRNVAPLTQDKTCYDEVL